MGISDQTIGEREAARKELKKLEAAPVTLSRLVYFIPGWRDEKGVCWMRMRQWLPRVIANASTHCFFIDLCKNDGSFPPWEDFLDFGDDVAELIAKDVGTSTNQVDLVCHSMGGLDALAAIALLDGHPELKTPDLGCVRNIITYDTPFYGFAAASNQLLKKFVESGRKDVWTLLQLAAMEKDSKRIAEVKAARDVFLGHVDAFWPRGADNFDGLLEVPHESASFGEPDDFAPAVRGRYHEYIWHSDTSHSGTNGVTNDLRSVLETVRILSA